MKALLRLIRSGEIQLKAMKDKIVEQSERIEELKKNLTKVQNIVSDSVFLSNN